jgi:hypothetical protein
LYVAMHNCMYTLFVWKSFLDGISHCLVLLLILIMLHTSFHKLTDCSEATVPLEDTETACMLVTALSVDKEVCARDNILNIIQVFNVVHCMHDSTRL